MMNTGKCPPCIQTENNGRDYRLSPLTPAEYSSFSSQWLVGGWFGFVLDMVNNTEIFLLLLDRVTQSQGLFYFLYCHAGEQEVHGMFGGDNAGTGDTNCSKGYFRQHDIMLSIQRRRKGWVICNDGVCFLPRYH